MKLKIILSNQNKDIIFQGNPLNLPIRYEDIKKKSVELFDDEEPCIIHQSYAIQKLIDGFLKSLKGLDVQFVKLADLDVDYHFLNFENINDLYVTILR